MASSERIIDDEYCRAMGAYFVKQGEQIDQFVAEYVSILEEVKSKAIVSGAVSQALNSYITYVTKLDKKIGNISIPTKTEIEKFLTQVDSEDQYLF